LKLLLLLAFLALPASVHAQQMVTITAIEGATNSVSIGSDQFFTLLRLSSLNGPGAQAYVLRNGLAIAYYTERTFTNKAGASFPDKVFAGPATALLQAAKGAGHAQLSLEISPAIYPPATMIREADGPTKVTLQESTDLKRWILSTNGATHTLSSTNAKKFFRVKVERVDEKK
jgi:hypothetical protein